MNSMRLLSFVFIVIAFLMVRCGHTATLPHNTATADTAAAQKGLKDYYKDYFPIGVAVSPRALKTAEARLILQHFNSITAENAMKMGPIHPREDSFNWKDADSI